MRKIIHLDMDYFFAQVEIRDNPRLKTLPVAIGGPPESRSVICTSNYIARKWGVRSGMSSAHCKKLCPDLILIPPHFSKYQEAAATIHDIFHQYSDTVETLSLDEAYLDVTDSLQANETATKLALKIREEIYQKTKLTCSAGISYNKLLSKLATNVNKPGGQFTITPDTANDFLKNLPVEDLWGVGKVTAEKLHRFGLKTCADIQMLSKTDLQRMLGSFGDDLYLFSRGIDEREVSSEYERKSLGTENTFPTDLNRIEEIEANIKILTEDLLNSLNDYLDRTIKTIFVKIKYFDFERTTIERSALPPTPQNFVDLAKERLNGPIKPIRLLGVGVKFKNQEDNESDLPLLSLISSSLI